MSTIPKPRDRHQAVGWGAGTLALLMALLWGGNSVATKQAADTLPPLAVGAARFLIASFFLWPYLRSQGALIRLERHQWRPAIILGTMLFLQIWTFNLGVDYSNSSHATVLINTFIFWVALIEHSITRSVRLRWWQMLGLVIAAVGVLLCVGSSVEPTIGSPNSLDGQSPNTDKPTILGDVIMAFSALILAIKVIYTRSAVQVVPSDRLMLWHNLVGAILFLIATPFIDDWSRAGASGWGELWQKMTWGAWGGLLYSGLVVSGFCFVMHAWLLRHHSASHISVFSFATPLCGVMTAVLLRGDSLTWWMLASGACVAIAIALVNWSTSSGSQLTSRRN
ncbi:MAG: DMT family transporter [Planctomycetaceae bacterium]